MNEGSYPVACETLDPANWTVARELAHDMVDFAVEHLRDVRERPAWRDMPQEVRAAFEAPLPQGPTPLPEVWLEMRRNLLAYPMGNVHPRFWAWYMGSGSFTGALADFVAAVQGSNLGGGNHAAVLLDQQVVAWCR
jgi:aromatic-L-amino-acid/L-tryptophan decarboxylase